MNNQIKPSSVIEIASESRGESKASLHIRKPPLAETLGPSFAATNGNLPVTKEVPLEADMKPVGATKESSNEESSISQKYQEIAEKGLTFVEQVYSEVDLANFKGQVKQELASADDIFGVIEKVTKRLGERAQRGYDEKQVLVKLSKDEHEIQTIQEENSASIVGSLKTLTAAYKDVVETRKKIQGLPYFSFSGVKSEPMVKVEDRRDQSKRVMVQGRHIALSPTAPIDVSKLGLSLDDDSKD